MKKEKEKEKMVSTYHKENSSSLKALFMKADETQRVSFRDAYLAHTGMSYPSFYQKLADDKFRPLEIKAFYDIMKTHPL